MKKGMSLLLCAFMAAAVCMRPSPAYSESGERAKDYNIALGNQSVNPNIFDGDEATGWTFQYETATIDLGAVYRVDKVEIVSSSSNVLINGWGEAGRTSYDPIEGRNARYIFLTDYTYLTTSGESASTLFEVRVFGREMANIALGNTSAAGYEALFDGSRDTAVTFDVTDIVVDLGAAYETSSIVIDTAETKERVAVSRYSLDNSTWVYETPSAGTRLRYIVVTDYGLYNQKIPSTVKEIEIYGNRILMKNVALNCVTDVPEAAMYDGDEATGWTCTYYDFVVDLGGEYEVASVEILAQTTHSVAVQRYSLDNTAWVDGSPPYGAKVRYLVVTDYGWYYGGHVPSTIYEIKVNVEEGIKEFVNVGLLAKIEEANGPDGAECLIDGKDDTPYSGESVVLDLGREYLIRGISAVRGSISAASVSANGIDFSPLPKGACARARRVLVSKPAGVTEILIEAPLEEVDGALLVQNVSFVNDRAAIAAMAPRKSIGAAVTLANLSAFEEETEVYCGIYDEAGLLVDAARTVKTIPAFSVETITAEADTSDIGITDGYYAKAFLWTANDIKPLMKADLMENYMY